MCSHQQIPMSSFLKFIRFSIRASKPVVVAHPGTKMMKCSKQNNGGTKCKHDNFLFPIHTNNPIKKCHVQGSNDFVQFAAN